MSDQTVTGGPTGAPEPAPGAGPTAVGPYRILQTLGEGGFGTVYEAEQSHPVRRRVALKVIKPGMDTREVIARFEAERQALALMDHPHIARVLDAGATESGRPYFVMELVQGEPIAAYCDRNRLTIDERLALFEQVCAAVQHAHPKGVIHRDLKPSNVLVSTHDGPAVRRRSSTSGSPRRRAPADRQDAVHRAPAAARHAALHEPRAGRGQRRHRHPHRHLLAGRDPLRAADRDHAGRRPTRCGRPPWARSSGCSARPTRRGRARASARTPRRSTAGPRSAAPSRARWHGRSGASWTGS